MPVTVIATPGAPDANSFQTVAEIDTYYAARVPSTTANQWLTASADNKAAAAVMSTQWMTSLIEWTGYASTGEQSLPWPRQGMWTRNGWAYYDANVIPPELKAAQAEFARVLLLSDRMAESQIAVQSITNLKVGPIALGFDKNQLFNNTPQIIPDAVIDLLIPSWIDYVNNGPSMMRELERA